MDATTGNREDFCTSATDGAWESVDIYIGEKLPLSIRRAILLVNSPAGGY